MAETAMKEKEEVSDTQNPSKTSYPLQHIVPVEELHTVEWKVPFDISRSMSPDFNIFDGLMYLALESRDKRFTLELAHSTAGSVNTPFEVTAELVGKEVVLESIKEVSRQRYIPITFDFSTTKAYILRKSPHLHFRIRFQRLPSPFFSSDRRTFEDPYFRRLHGFSYRKVPPRTSIPPLRTHPRPLFDSSITALEQPGPSYADTRNRTYRMSYQNTSACLKSLASDLSKLYENENRSKPDALKLLCEGRTISAHRFILSARSKVFRDKLQGEDYQNGCLEVNDIRFSVIHKFLEYIYTASLPRLTEDLARELSEAADKYAIHALKDRCDNFLKNPSSSQNNCNCLQSLSVDLHELYNDESGHDVKLLCGEESTSAHRDILSARSDVFMALLEDSQTDCIEVKDMDMAVLRLLLRYVYTGILPEMTKELAVELLKAAGTYEIRGLKARCLEFLMKDLETSNACDMFVLADAVGDKDFKSSVTSFMVDERVPFNKSIWKPFCDTHPQLAIEVLNEYVYCQCIARGENIGIYSSPKFLD